MFDLNKMSVTDLIETAELLRASHTILRMSFGAVTLSMPGVPSEESKSLSSHYDSVFTSIADAYKRYIDAADRLRNDGAGSDL